MTNRRRNTNTGPRNGGAADSLTCAGVVSGSPQEIAQHMFSMHRITKVFSQGHPSKSASNSTLPKVDADHRSREQNLLGLNADRQGASIRLASAAPPPTTAMMSMPEAPADCRSAPTTLRGWGQVRSPPNLAKEEKKQRRRESASDESLELPPPLRSTHPLARQRSPH